MANKKLICFDIDGTLVDNKTSFVTLIEGLGCPVDKVLSIYGAVMAGKISFPEGEAQVSGIIRSSGKATMEFVQKILEKDPIKEESFEVIKYLKNIGYDIWLVSGAIDIRAGAVAKKIGATGFYAHSSLEFDGQGVFTKINYGGDQNPWKAGIVKKLASENGIHAVDIVFVGDGAIDIEAFKLTGRGIAVYPYDKDLERVAWKKIKSLSEIKDILQ